MTSSLFLAGQALQSAAVEAEVVAYSVSSGFVVADVRQPCMDWIRRDSGIIAWLHGHRRFWDEFHLQPGCCGSSIPQIGGHSRPWSVGEALTGTITLPRNELISSAPRILWHAVNSKHLGKETFVEFCWFVFFFAMNDYQSRWQYFFRRENRVCFRAHPARKYLWVLDACLTFSADTGVRHIGGDDGKTCATCCRFQQNADESKHLWAIVFHEQRCPKFS